MTPPPHAMPKLDPFTLTPAAVRKVVADTTALGAEGYALRVAVYYTRGNVTRQYATDLVEQGEADDVTLRFAAGPLKVFVERESYMRLWGHVLDVRPLEGDRPGELGLGFRPPPTDA